MSTAGTEPAGISTSTGGKAGQGSSIPGLASDAVSVCTYTASGREHTVAVYRDKARTTYFLVSSLFSSPIAQPISVESTDLFSYEIAPNHTLFARTLASGLIRFYDSRHELRGEGYSFASVCSADGVQATHFPKRAPRQYLEITRDDGSTYRADLDEWEDIGSHPIQFYTVADGTTVADEPKTRTELGTRICLASSTPDAWRTYAFTDLDGRWVSIDVSAYSEIIAIRVSSQ